MIEVKALSLFYGELEVLHDVSFSVQSGELVVLKGESGRGKSSLLSLLALLQKPTSGAVMIDGVVASKLTDTHAAALRRDTIAYISQSFDLFEQLSVKENLLAAMVLQDISLHAIEEKIDSALSRANIAHKKDECVANLSGGEKQRCAIARALIKDTKIVLCDEPTSALDPNNKELFKNIIQELLKEGKIVIIATHENLFDDLECHILKL